MDEVLQEYQITEIDYVSLDVEGCEFDILKSIDFNRAVIKCFTIENEDNSKMINMIRCFMIEHGYILIARLSQDDVWVNKNYFFRREE